MEFYADVARAGGLKKTGGHITVKGNLRIGIVVDDKNLILLGELHDLVEERRVAHDPGGRGVGIDKEKDLGLAGDGRWNVFQIWQIVILRVQSDRMDPSASQDYTRIMDGVSRRGDQ